MSLRVKVELILFVTMVALVGLGYGIQRFLVLPALNPLEEQAARKSMALFAQALDKQAATLLKQGEAWSQSSAFIRAVASNNQSLLNARLSSNVFARNDLALVCLLDDRGQILYGKAVDPTTGKVTHLQDLHAISWVASKAIQFDSSASGVIMTRDGPMLVASVPIIAPADSQAVLARLILAHALDPRFISSHFDTIANGVEILSASDPRLSQNERDLLHSLTGDRAYYVTHANADQVRAYAVYPDITGKSALLLRTVLYRTILAHANDSLRTGLLVEVGIGLTALVVLIILFRRTVLNPLSRLTTHAVAVAETNDLSSRIGLKRGDEIGALAREFDSMVARLEQDRERQKRDEEALRESEERYVLAVRGANDGLWDWNVKSNEVHFSTRWKTMLGHDENEIGNELEEWFKRIHPEDKENVKAALDAHLSGQTAHFESEHRMITKNRDTYLWVLCRGLAIRDENGEATRMAGSLSDITLRKLFEEQLSHLALHDSLTALPNRTLLLDRISQSLKHIHRDPHFMFAVLFLDLDRFKVVNDGLGHVVGDHLLTAVAERLNHLLRDTDTVCRTSNTVSRFGGDEFVILLDRLSSLSDASIVAERIQEELRKPFHIEGREIFTTSSIGIALGEEAYQSAEEVLRNADTAMYRAKAEGKDRYAIFDSDMGAKAMAHVQLENDLRRAIEHKEFLVYYQPVVSLATGKIEALEALVRWRHPERGLVPPIEFIPLAEETGMIVPIGEWVLETACRQTRSWQQTLPQAADLVVNVNLAAADFSRKGLVERIEQQLLVTGLSPQHLKLEITEGALIENIDSVITVLKRLREMHVQLAIDDFGTGYSSLSYLHRFPMNTLKIDRAFIRDLRTEPESMQIVKSILLLAQALEVNVVAEGIEDAEQLRFLRDFGCGYGQGYYFSCPLDRKACEDLLVSAPQW